MDLSCNTRLRLGKKNYRNFKMDWTQLDKPFKDNVDWIHVPRIPWRALRAVVHRKADRDLARHFIEYWNFTQNFNRKYKVKFYLRLLPNSHTTPDELPCIVPGATKASVQVLRLVGHCPARTCESSTQNAYVDTLETGQHYIHIENQFFISFAETVCNTVGNAIVKRILHAHSVYVVIPLLPRFEGDSSEGAGNAFRAILHYTYSTINCGIMESTPLYPNSRNRGRTNGHSTSSVHTHFELGHTPITELIYIHSKVLIADDRCYSFGSANINNRSMMGYQRGELAILVDEERVPSQTNREEYEAVPLALALRKKCFGSRGGAIPKPQ